MGEEDNNKRMVKIDAVNLGAQIHWQEAIKFYLTHLVRMAVVVGLSAVVFVTGVNFLAFFSEVIMEYDFNFSSINGVVEIGFIKIKLVDIAVTIYCGIVYHYIYTVKRLKSFRYIAMGIVAVLISLFVGGWIGGGIALIFPSFLTTRKKEKDIIGLKNDKSNSFYAVIC